MPLRRRKIPLQHDWIDRPYDADALQKTIVPQTIRQRGPEAAPAFQGDISRFYAASLATAGRNVLKRDPADHAPVDREYTSG